MCGRYEIVDGKRIIVRFKVANTTPEMLPNQDVRPTHQVPALLPRAGAAFAEGQGHEHVATRCDVRICSSFLSTGRQTGSGAGSGPRLRRRSCIRCSRAHRAVEQRQGLAGAGCGRRSSIRSMSLPCQRFLAISWSSILGPRDDPGTARWASRTP